ncbi:MAG TPA: GWxTD domain-containing protein [Lentimicrobium sp.]|nr:GWxTD domain-containing protein [Lentimicrobium sp.]
MYLSVVCCMLALSFYSCKGPGKLAYRNLADIYKQEAQLKGLEFSVFNLNDSVSNLYIRFPLSSLKRMPDLNKENLTGAVHFKLTYQLFDGYEQGVMVDSASFSGLDSLLVLPVFFDSIALNARQGKDYILDLQITDLNAKRDFHQLVTLPKAKMGTAADILICDVNGLPLMRNFINRADLIRLRYRDGFTHHFQLLRVISDELKAASPPFAFGLADNKMAIDSVKININNNNRSYTDVLTFQQQGIYLDSENQVQGIKLYSFYDGFPKISKESVMVESLRYIASDAEYRNMQKLNPRVAIDEFWRSVTGDSERSVVQLKRYYGRVEEANRAFTISREGWKSDRGMIYIVFGSPYVVYRNSEVEEWTYGEPGNASSVRFVFKLQNSSNGIQDYFLLRSEDFRMPWHLAVSNWRR